MIRKEKPFEFPRCAMQLTPTRLATILVDYLFDVQHRMDDEAPSPGIQPSEGNVLMPNGSQVSSTDLKEILRSFLQSKRLEYVLAQWKAFGEAGPNLEFQFPKPSLVAPVLLHGGLGVRDLRTLYS
jgi:hypothetical protein